MSRKFHIIIPVISIILLFLSLSIRLFMMEISYSDDPTLSLAIKNTPTLSYFEVKDRDDLASKIVLADEHNYPFDFLINFLASYGIILFPFLLLFSINLKLFRKRSGNFKLPPLVNLPFWIIITAVIIPDLFLLLLSFKYYNSHTGVNYTQLIYWYLFLIITDITLYLLHYLSIKQALVIFFFTILSILLLLTLYYGNIVLPYEEWLQKGIS